MNRVSSRLSIRTVGIVLAGCIGIVVVGIGSLLCIVETVRVYGDQHVLTNTNALQQKAWLPMVDSLSLSQKLALDNPLAKNIVISKQYPNTLEVTVERRIPVAALKSDTGYLITDEEGVIIATDPGPAALPIITSDHITLAGNYIDDSIIAKSIQIVSNSMRNGFVVKTITISSENQLITIDFDGGTILFPGNKNIDYLFSSLQLLLPQFRIEGKQSVVLDFRFDKPIIR